MWEIVQLWYNLYIWANYLKIALMRLESILCYWQNLKIDCCISLSFLGDCFETQGVARKCTVIRGTGTLHHTHQRAIHPLEGQRVWMWSHTVSLKELLSLYWIKNIKWIGMWLSIAREGIHLVQCRRELLMIVMEKALCPPKASFQYSSICWKNQMRCPSASTSKQQVTRELQIGKR